MYLKSKILIVIKFVELYVSRAAGILTSLLKSTVCWRNQLSDRVGHVLGYFGLTLARFNPIKALIKSMSSCTTDLAVCVESSSYVKLQKCCISLMAVFALFEWILKQNQIRIFLPLLVLAWRDCFELCCNNGDIKDCTKILTYQLVRNSRAEEKTLIIAVLKVWLKSERYTCNKRL